MSKFRRMADKPAFKLVIARLRMKLEGKCISAQRECLIAAHPCRSELL